MFRKFLLVVPALCLAVPAMAQDQAAAAPAAKPAKPHKPKRVCREENLTGSRMPRSFCHTVDEWAAIDAGKAPQDARDGVRSLSADPSH